MIHPNSRAAYLALQEAGELQPKEMMILNALESFGPMTRQELEVAAGMRLSCVCGRVHALLEKGAIKEDGERFNPATGKHNAILRLLAVGEEVVPAQMDLLEAA
jgi:DNA-binding MarR family transcriptional regulator